MLAVFDPIQSHFVTVVDETGHALKYMPSWPLIVVNFCEIVLATTALFHRLQTPTTTSILTFLIFWSRNSDAKVFRDSDL